MLGIRQFALPHTAKQFFGLLLEISEIGFLRQLTRHALLLLWPGVRYDGQKRSQCSVLRNSFKAGSSRSADRMQPDLHPRVYPKPIIPRTRATLPQPRKRSV